ncbi:hypothetical protein TRFO_21679 [Tritrichomonas foetus]|uniref:Uncharacterized protein n=1 Tax=Tritrichomonas foetus TaxID=1144522 RepID=A0A1J4KD69_9EUKA|nr:hypothetical protein TRFO_21679 [Tritrichomonas foetus]|eukprot:OHT09375.1 hypothetical protein TRFO_21679 [Tritrichomonas foetus]
MMVFFHQFPLIDIYQYIVLTMCILFATYQIYTAKMAENSKIPLPEYKPNYFEKHDFDPKKKSANPLNESFPLPLVNRSAPQSDSKWAEQFLRLPTWSHGYQKCDSADTEVSCYELVRAAKAVERWEKSIKSNSTTGQVWVHVTNEEFPDTLSMLYHGLQIAVLTNRELITEKNKFAPIVLPDSVKDAKKDEGGQTLKTDYTFACSDVSSRFPNVKFSGSSWPQVLYTHNTIAQPLREEFGFHAAYFLGNYLFGTLEKPGTECFLQENLQTIEGWRFMQDPDMLRPKDYLQYIDDCGLKKGETVMITNDNDSNFHDGDYRMVKRMNSKSTQSLVCALRTLISSKRIVQTFGSRLGFWATALQGKAGGFMNTIDNICVNLTNSQQGSIYHTYCPADKTWLYRTNTWFYICGPTVDHAKKYLDYLLW